MDRMDLVRELDKIDVVLLLALEHHEKANESNAALHASTKVIYSPLTVKLQTAQHAVRNLMTMVENDGVE